jgi:sortase A
MLHIQTRTKRRTYISIVVTIVAILALIAGFYILSLVFAPAVAPMISQKTIDVKKLPTPTAKDNRIIIPKIGVNIAYAPGVAALNAGAEWRYPDRGNPEKGGNFIIAAHRLTIQPTPWATVEKSPFYNIDKLAISDKIIIDYSGTRYGYNISKIFNVTPNQVEIEAPTETPQLTLYSCDLTGAATGRVVIIAEPMGKVAVNGDQQAN